MWALIVLLLFLRLYGTEQGIIAARILLLTVILDRPYGRDYTLKK